MVLKNILLNLNFKNGFKLNNNNLSNNKNMHLSRIELDKYILLELPDNELKEVKLHLENCELCSGALNKIKEDQNTFSVENGLKDFKKQLFTASSQIHKETWYSNIIQLFNPAVYKPIYTGLSVLCLLLIAAFIFKVTDNKFVDSVGTKKNVLTVKGSSRLDIFVKRGENIKKAMIYETVYKGDAIKFAYSNSKYEYLLIVSISDENKITAYFPYNGDKSQKINRGNSIEISGSLIFDEENNSELIIGIFSNKILILEDVKVSLEEQIRHSEKFKELNLNLEAELVVKYFFDKRIR